MTTDTDNNFLVSGASANAVVATDYSDTESSHFQVVKVAYGSTQDFNRVTDADGLPVRIMNTPQVDVTNISNPVPVFGSLGVYGINGATAIGITAAGFDIRGLTHTKDSIRVLGGITVISGNSSPYNAYDPFVGFQTRLLRATTGATATETFTQLVGKLLNDPPSVEDTVRVVGLSGAFPVRITATELDIRGLTHGKDSITVFNTVSVQNDLSNSPFDAKNIDAGFQTRLLRASSGSDPTTNSSALVAAIDSVEDTVRVVGLSGAYPVAVMPIGLTGITNYASRTPFKVDDTGALYVNLGAASVNVSANISSTAFTLAGVSLSNAGSSAGVIQMQGYAGTGVVPVTVSATDLDIRNLTSASDSVLAQIRLLGGACADSVDLGGTAGTVMEKFNSALNKADTVYQLKTDDVQSGLILSEITTANTGIKALTNNISESLMKDYRITGVGTDALGETSFSADAKALRVVVANVVQPDGITSGRLDATTSAVQMGSHFLKSGIHFKSDLGNSNKTIFIGSTNQNQIGYPLYNGDQVFIETDNTNKIYYSATAGATLYYMGT